MNERTLQDLCELARLTLSASEHDDFAAKFDSLLAFVDQIQAYTPVGDGVPLTLIEELEPRHDIPAPFDWPEGYLRPYRVPAVIDFEEGR